MSSCTMIGPLVRAGLVLAATAPTTGTVMLGKVLSGMESIVLMSFTRQREITLQLRIAIHGC